MNGKQGSWILTDPERPERDLFALITRVAVSDCSGKGPVRPAASRTGEDKADCAGSVDDLMRLAQVNRRAADIRWEDKARRQSKPKIAQAFRALKQELQEPAQPLDAISNAKLSLHWNIQPWVGALVWTNRNSWGRWQGLKGGIDKFDFPSLKGSETVKREDLKTETGQEGRRGSPS